MRFRGNAYPHNMRYVYPSSDVVTFCVAAVSSTGTLKELARTKIQHVPTLKMVLSYLEVSSKQEYIVQRIKGVHQMESGPCLSCITSFTAQSLQREAASVPTGGTLEGLGKGGTGTKISQAMLRCVLG